jgi:hypothetical protein
MKTDSTTRELTPRDDIGRLFPVLFMFLSFGNMIVCLGMVLFIQHPAAYAMCALLYATLVATELRFKIKSPVSISMLVLYIGLTILDYQTDQYKGYAGTVVFSWLSLLTSSLLLWKKPFTAFYSSGRGMKQLHYTVSTLWCLTYIFSFMASTLLMPHVSFILVHYILCISCGLLTIFLNFFWFGKRNRFQQSFIIGDFSFRRVNPNSSEFIRFCNFYAQQIYRPGDDGNGKTEREIFDVVATVECDLGLDSYIFIAEHEMRVIGCIRCVVDRQGRPFPLEEDMQLSFDPLRRIGRVLYVGRLAVDPAYRERPDVLNGLFKCFVDLALSKDVSFVVAEGFSHRLPTYLKLGFEILFERSDPRHAIKMSHGYICHPVYLNFAKLIFHRSESAQSKYQFADFINKYLVERWYKRNALSQIFKPSANWPWRFSLKQIRTIL